VVPQSPVFFRGTILDNLTLFGRGPSAQEACGAVAMVGLDRDIDRLPRGYASELGEGVSETLPPGLLKRLALARALADPARHPDSR
jgi:ABC-type transport system involved in cytochrome bd biosynthesis fused ATPase/permease subunit